MKTLTKEELIHSIRGDNTKRRNTLYSSVKVLEAPDSTINGSNNDLKILILDGRMLLELVVAKPA